MNAINPAMLDRLNLALDEALSVPEIKTVVLTGGPANFCAGADLSFIESAAEDRKQRSAEFLAALQLLFARIEQLPMPTVAVVTGYALAGGLELLLCCDLVLAADTARIGDAHANYGLLPGGGGSVRLPERIGIGRAKYLMFTGQNFGPDSQHLGGLVNGSFPADELENAAEDLVRSLDAKSRPGLRRMKQLLDPSFERWREAGFERELLINELHAGSEDLEEGLKAFESKRNPNFRDL